MSWFHRASIMSVVFLSASLCGRDCSATVIATFAQKESSQSLTITGSTTNDHTTITGSGIRVVVSLSEVSIPVGDTHPLYVEFSNVVSTKAALDSNNQYGFSGSILFHDADNTNSSSVVLTADFTNGFLNLTGSIGHLDLAQKQNTTDDKKQTLTFTSTQYLSGLTLTLPTLSLNFSDGFGGFDGNSGFSSTFNLSGTAAATNSTAPPQEAAVPEPSTVLSAAIGVLMLAGSLARRRNVGA